MKKLISLIFLSFIFFLSSSVVQAQRDPNRVPLSDPYQEYIYNLNLFYSDRKEYESARSKYLSYKTEQSKADAIKATKNMLESGRISMIQYIDLLTAYLNEQEPLSQRVKTSVLQDLQIHKDFLNTSADTITKIVDLTQAKDAADALNLRLSYVRTTSSQALNYTDAVSVKKQIDQSRVVVNQFSSIIQGYPEDNRSKSIVDGWISETTTEITSVENDLNTFIEGIYPLPAQTTQLPGYQVGGSGSIEQLNNIRNKLQSYTNKFREMNTVIKKAYAEL